MKYTAFFNLLWACEEQYMAKMIAVLEKKGEITKEELASYSNSAKNKVYYFDAATTMEGKARKNSKPQYVAVIPVMGAMFKRAGWIEQASGLKGTEQLIQEIRQAKQDSSIVGILLQFDSPGGTVDGTETLGNEIRNSEKPIVAFADGMIASAAYWAGSQAKEVWASESSSMVGSIGVITRHINNAEYYKMNGQEVTYIVSTGSEKKIIGNDTQSLSDSDRASIKESLDATRQVFENTVRAARPSISPDAFDGGIYNADKAKSLGMIDGICTLQDAVNRVVQLANSSDSNNNNTNNSSAKMEGKSEAQVLREVMQSQIDEQKQLATTYQAQLAEKEKQLAALQVQANEVSGLKEKVAKLEEENASLKNELDKQPANLGTSVATKVDANNAGEVKRPTAKRLSDALNAEASKTDLVEKYLR